MVQNLLKDTDLKVTRQITRWLNEHGVIPYMLPEVADVIEEKAIGIEKEKLYHQCEAMVVIGGDGTILREAELASKNQLPIIGINLGRLGFLADIEKNDIDSALAKLIQEEFEIEKRMMLKATVINETGEKREFHALNDINITRGNFSRIVEFEIKVNDVLSDIYRADGVIVATPTGSTAYNLSAGGPIVVPNANTYVVTPICPHTIYSKSVMLCTEDKVSIRTLEETKNMALSIDGQLKLYLTPNDHVYIERSPYITQLIKISKREFFEILREKIVERRI